MDISEFVNDVGGGVKLGGKLVILPYVVVSVSNVSECSQLSHVLTRSLSSVNEIF